MNERRELNKNREDEQQLKRNPGSGEHVTKKARAENDMTKTLVVVVLMFMCCQLLNPIRRIISNVQNTGNGRRTTGSSTL